MFVLSLAALLLLLAPNAFATSSSEDVSSCDAEADYWGCAAGYPTDRNGNLQKLLCKEKDGRIMHCGIALFGRASPRQRPADRAPAHSRRAQGDCTGSHQQLPPLGRRRVQARHNLRKQTFFASGQLLSSRTAPDTPGKLHTVSLRVTKHRQVYRGLLLYAADAQGNRVGSWELPPDEPQLFHVHDGCDNAVMHTSAEHKPYLVSFKWRAPATAVGPIKFPALIKYGDANDGDFFWPNEDGTFELKPGAAAAKPAVQWVRSDVGETCTNACARVERGCDASKLMALDSAAKLEAAVGDEHACKLPLLRGCNAVGPTSSVDAFCYYHNPTLCAQAPPTPTCDATSDSEHYGQRFCPCVESNNVPQVTSKQGTNAAGATTASGPKIYEPIDCTPGETMCSCNAEGGCALATDECLQESVCVRMNCVGEKGCPCSKGRCLSGGDEQLECALLAADGVDGICQLADATIGAPSVDDVDDSATAVFVQVGALVAAVVALLLQ